MGQGRDTKRPGTAAAATATDRGILLVGGTPPALVLGKSPTKSSDKRSRSRPGDGGGLALGRCGGGWGGWGGRGGLAAALVLKTTKGASALDAVATAMPADGPEKDLMGCGTADAPGVVATTPGMARPIGADGSEGGATGLEKNDDEDDDNDDDDVGPAGAVTARAPLGRKPAETGS